jgi:hypothetical protein
MRMRPTPAPWQACKAWQLLMHAHALLQARDPIPALRKYLLDNGVLGEAALKDIEAEVTAVVDDAVKFADESPKPVRTLALLPCCCPPWLAPAWQGEASLCAPAAVRCGAGEALLACSSTLWILGDVAAGEGAAAGERVCGPQGLWHCA